MDRIDAKGPNQIEGAWIAPTADMDDHARREKRLGHRDGKSDVELSQHPVFVGDAKSLVCRTITNHRTRLARGGLI